MARRPTLVSFFLLALLLFATIANGQGVELQPSSGNAGTTLDVVLNGASFGPDDVTITFQPPGLTVRNPRLVNRLLVFTLDIGANAPAGSYAMVLTPPAARAAAAATPIIVPNAFRVIRQVVRVRSVTPAQITAGTSIEITILGSGFQPRPDVDVQGSGLTAKVKSSNDTTINATLTAAATAAPGPRPFFVENRDGSSSRDQSPVPVITVVAAPVRTPPLVTGVTPPSAAQGATLLVRIEGSGFQPGASVKLGNGVNANVMKATPAEIIANVVIAPEASPGDRRVIVRNPDGLTNDAQPRPIDFSITAAAAPRVPPAVTPPLVTSITPASAAQGATLLVRIAGSGFQTGASVKLGNGVTANVMSVTPAEIVASVVVAPEASPGERRVIVRNPDGLTNDAQPRPIDFSITAAAAPRVPPAPTPPLVTSITPASAAQGATLLARIAGSGFQTGASVNLGTGVSANVMSVTPEEIVANVGVAAGATLGAHRVIVRNPDGLTNESQRRPVDLTITAPSVTPRPLPTPPVVTSIAPSSAEQGASPLVRIAGSGFQTGASVSLGNGVSATVISVTPGEIAANLRVAADAPPGPHRVVVRNPDGLSNESQPRPVDLTITAATRTPQPPVRTPPVVTSIAPGTVEPGASPLARISGSGFQTGATVNLGTGVTANVTSVTAGEIVASLVVAATATPGPHRVVVRNPDGMTNESQPQPVDLLVTPGKVVVKPPPVVLPPTMSVKGPRVDAMKPQKVTPGSTYTLDVEGKNFSPDMKIGLGKDITILGVPIVLAPTKAKLQVLVLPAAKQGVVVAVASSPAGQNSGPGGVMIGSAAKTSAPPSKKDPPTQKPPMTINEPTGTIKLLHPCDAAFDATCTDVHMLDDATEFDWKELTPGIAQVFVFEIVSAKENVLYTAQTTAPYLEWSGGKLTALFEKIAAGPPKQTSPAGGTAVGSPTATGGSGLTGPPSGIDNVGTTGPVSGFTPGQGGVSHATKKGTPFQMLASTFPDAVFWRVRGLRAKTGKPKEMYVAEESEARPLALPKTPNGFSCPSSKAKLDLVPVPDDQYSSEPCETKAGKYSSNICSGMTAQFSTNSTLDMTKVPFEFQTVGQAGWNGSVIVQYGNVFVDWGDGSEPTPLSIIGKASDSPAKSHVAAGHKHKYVNSNTSSEHQDYSVRIYAVADDSKMSLLDLAKAAQKSSTGVKGVHTLACTTVRIWNQIDLTKEMPLTLVSALTVFPDDWSNALAASGVGVGLGSGSDVVLIDGKGLQNAPGVFGNTGGNSGNKASGGKTTQAGGVAPAGGTGAQGVPSGQVLSGNIPTYGIDTSGLSKVSECAEAFRPFVRIHYWGKGRARIRWTLDGKVIEERETPELPPVTYNDAMYGKLPYDIDLTIPLPAKLKNGSNIHFLKVHVETGKPPKSMTSATGAAPASQGMTGMKPGSGQLVSSTKPPVSGGGPTLAGPGTAGQAGNSGVTPGQTSPPVAPGAAGKFEVFDPGEGSSMDGPYSAVDAVTRGYEVVKKLPGVPCRIIYKTVKSGTLYITDITEFQLDKGSSTGKGKLKIVLPGVSGSTTEYAAVTFNQWKLQPRPGQETDFDALSGNLSVKTFAEGVAMNFPVRITAVSLNPERLLISGAVSLPSGNLKPETNKMPEWPFTDAILSSGGRFAFTSTAKRTVVLGTSLFKLDITTFEFDLSSMKAPANACSKSSFSGALVSGTLRAPQAVTFGKSSIFANVNVEKWAVRSTGLSVHLDNAPLGKTVTESAVKITTSDVSFDSCSGGYATAFQLAINGIKFFKEGITGDGSLDAQGNLLVTLHPATAAKTWTNADIEVSSLSLHRKNDASWYFLANGSFAFRSHGKLFQKVQYEEMTLGFDGTLVLPSQTVNNVEQTTTSLGGFPYTITKFTASNSGNALKFTFTGDIKFGEHVPTATNRDVTFSLSYKNASLSDPPATLLADMPLFDEGPVALLVAPPDEGSGEAEPEVQAVDIDLMFPEGVGTVQIKAKCKWTSTGSGYRFTTDDGTISVMDSLKIQKTRFVFGNDSGESYWLAQASFQLPTPVQLGTTPLYLFAIGGGIGHNVDITSFNAPVENIVAAHSANYLFSADVDVGTLTDGETFWSNGRVTVQFNDGFAVRADLQAWILTTNHTQPPAAVGCMMYSGGAFSAGFGVHYEQAGLIVDAPAGPDPCQGASVHIYFAGSNDFHVNVGTPTAPVSAQMAGVKGSGSFSFDPSGASFNFVMHYVNEVTLDIGICTAHAGYNFYWGLGAGFTFDPFSLTGSATAGAAVGAGCGVFDVGAGGDVSLSVTLPGSASVCGALHIYVKVLGDKYWLINTGEFCV